ncbi:hypothetical protein BAUCODRAFT_142201 [Baudoinia panamericana UAMH 10762]|uniref:Uncharacterized protein n=1 Tax=Baudoinia panamericana (strain UAMH 10762) TaxID=717646 RepID=M2M8C3_BAUPA|nr:uncharacterized protein BAUCODRAFT_142201 [Baudoinia panamericana UAMH 10762]EMC92616.1 hypothetical protein BAUCODRAFT_142201 [Baudoinia panamericana UAMH 10762]
MPRTTSTDSDLMPPPSTRKHTPKRSPIKSIRSAVNTPRPLSRADSYSRSTPPPVPEHSQSKQNLINEHIQDNEDANIDDTCFSTFSQIPEMTVFARLGQSPTKQGDIGHVPNRHGATTPRSSRKRPSPSRSPSPTPRRQKTPGTLNQDGTTSFLIDFTQQMESVNSYRPSSAAKSATESNLLQYINNQRSPHKPSRPSSYATPSKPSSILNLLDFELPPAPTPRSIPTITVRELESLKSSYLSQISSLKATLSGREAEVESLKRAISDAERRVGEAQETMREEKCRREQVEEEKAGWERRGLEVENVLKSVKEEVLRVESEREELVRKVEDGDKRVETMEARAVRAEERFAEALSACGDAGDGDAGVVEERVQRLVAAQIDAKIEAVSRELHAVYKEKHERKVATLKKSYEARSEKKCGDLQMRLAEAERQNEELLNARVAASSTTISGVGRDAELKAALEEQKASLIRLQTELRISHQQQDQLQRELQQERIEKGDLVAAVDEMLTLQADSGAAAAGSAMSVVEDFRKSISRPSGLRAPGAAAGSGASRIGGPAALNRSVSGGAGKSRLLSNIERMGRAGHAVAGGGAPVEQ